MEKEGEPREKKQRKAMRKNQQSAQRGTAGFPAIIRRVINSRRRGKSQNVVDAEKYLWYDEQQSEDARPLCDGKEGTVRQTNRLV